LENSKIITRKLHKIWGGGLLFVALGTRLEVMALLLACNFATVVSSVIYNYLATEISLFGGK